MPLDTFYLASEVAKEWDDEFVYIGGGEPTLHPDFFKILFYLMRHFDNVELTTNGSRDKVMHRLRYILWEEDEELCNHGMSSDNLTVALSLDQYHDPISQWIKDWFKKAEEHNHRMQGSLGGHKISTYIKGDYMRVLSNAGRAKKNQLRPAKNKCVCPDIFIKPSGDIRLCGCIDAPIIGHVGQGISYEWEKFLHSEQLQDSKFYQDDQCIKVLQRCFPNYKQLLEEFQNE